MTLLLILLLLASGGLLFLLPLLPSLREIGAKIDASAIPVSPRDKMDTRHFAQRFHRVARTTIIPALVAAERGRKSRVALANGDVVRLVPAGDYRASGEEATRKRVTAALASDGDLNLDEGVEFLREVFTRGSLMVGRGSRVRAAYAEQDLVLAEDAVAERWIHADRLLRLQPGAFAYGRASAEDSIVLEAPCGFSRLRAPSIEIDERGYTDTWRAHRESLTEQDIQKLPGVVDFTSGRALVHGDLKIDASRSLRGSLVVHGDLHVGAGTHLRGSVKAHGKVVMDEGVHLEGSVVAHGDIEIGVGCRVDGPVLSESDLKMGERCQIGDILRPATIRAERIRLSRGSVVHGAVWASLKGEVTK